jgi:hypothetical protein
MIGTNEKVVTVDGAILVDPALDYRQRAQDFIASRQWSTTQVFYADQPEPDEEDFPPLWSLSFELGLDHITATDKNWCDDIGAIIAFFQSVQAETNGEFVMEVRYRSKLWYSETIAFIDEKIQETDSICNMIKRV